MALWLYSTILTSAPAGLSRGSSLQPEAHMYPRLTSGIDPSPSTDVTPRSTPSPCTDTSSANGLSDWPGLCT